MPTLKALLLLNGPRVRVFFMKTLARLRLRWTALILRVKGPLENPFISKKERVERYVRLHTLGIPPRCKL